MIGGKDLRAQLEGRLRAGGVAAAEKVLCGVAVDGELKELEQVDKLLKFVPKSNAKVLYGGALVGGVCLVVASLLWTVRLPTASLQLIVKSESVTIVLAQELNWSGDWDLSGGLLRLEDMSRIELPPETADSNLRSSRVWLEIRNGDVGLKHLEAKTKAQLSVAKGDLGIVNINSRNAAMLGQLEVVGKPVMEAGSSPEQSVNIAGTQFDIPGTVTFFHEATPVPAVLRVMPKGTLDLLDLHVQDISFAKEVANSGTPFRSGITDGSVTVLSTGEKVSLQQGGRLRLEGADGVISRFTIGPEGANLTFEGEVRSAAIGPPGFERQLKPSLLEYLYHQQRLGFFWAAASFLWGLLWSARTLIFR